MFTLLEQVGKKVTFQGQAETFLKRRMISDASTVKHGQNKKRSLYWTPLTHNKRGNNKKPPLICFCYYYISFISFFSLVTLSIMFVHFTPRFGVSTV